MQAKRALTRTTVSPQHRAIALTLRNVTGKLPIDVLVVELNVNEIFPLIAVRIVLPSPALAPTCVCDVKNFLELSGQGRAPAGNRTRTEDTDQAKPNPPKESQ